MLLLFILTELKKSLDYVRSADVLHKVNDRLTQPRLFLDPNGVKWPPCFL